MSIGNPVHENRNRDKYLLQGVESTTIGEIELPENVLPDKAYQWDNNVWVVENKLAIKVSKI